MKKKRNRKPSINCLECKDPTVCCRMGAWIDLEEAKKIVAAGIKGDFFHLEMDKDFPSGYCVGTSYEDEPCSFLRADGLCSVHKFGYHLKPVTCKEFPYEKKRISSFADVLCTVYKSKKKKKKSK